MRAFLVAPHSADPEFGEKAKALSELAQEAGMQASWAGPVAIRESGKESIGITELRSADFVIGDLSYERPSCYFEIGLAQGMNKPVFLIAKRGTTLHQVIGRSSIGFYSDMAEYKQIIRGILGTLRA